MSKTSNMMVQLSLTCFLTMKRMHLRYLPIPSIWETYGADLHSTHSLERRPTEPSLEQPNPGGPQTVQNHTWHHIFTVSIWNRSSAFTTSMPLKITGQLLCRMLIWSLWLNSDYAFWQEYQRSEAAFLLHSISGAWFQFVPLKMMFTLIIWVI